jgi:hypothetical protein
MILFLLTAAYCVTFGLMNDRLVGIAWVRERVALFDRLFDCAFCTGFHAGWVVLLTAYWGGVYPSAFLGSGIGGGFLFCAVSSVFCYSLDLFLEKVEGTQG